MIYKLCLVCGANGPNGNGHYHDAKGSHTAWWCDDHLKQQHLYASDECKAGCYSNTLHAAEEPRGEEE